MAIKHLLLKSTDWLKQNHKAKQKLPSATSASTAQPQLLTMHLQQNDIFGRSCMCVRRWTRMCSHEALDGLPSSWMAGDVLPLKMFERHVLLVTC